MYFTSISVFFSSSMIISLWNLLNCRETEAGEGRKRVCYITQDSCDSKGRVHSSHTDHKDNRSGLLSLKADNLFSAKLPTKKSSESRNHATFLCILDMNVTDGKIKTVVSSFHSFSVSQESETFQLQTAGAESTAPFSLNSVVALAATISISKMKRTSLKDSKGPERRACLFREGKWSGAGAVMTVKHWRVDRSFDRCLLNKVTLLIL